MDLEQASATYLPRIEAELRACLTDASGLDPAFFGMLHYHMGWTDDQFQPVQVVSGKRLRPLFTLLVCRAAGGEPERALPAAAAVELLHNFSLIHDDIQDNSPTRRGRPTVWSIWGVAQAINAGDALFTLAHLALHRLAAVGLPAARLVAIWRVFDEACLALCRGQHLDLAFETRLDVDSSAYLRMIQGKTAALLGCAGQLGALVASDSPARAQRYRRLGEDLGLAYQIQDDILGIWGQPEVTGKPVGDDIRSRKKTLPIVYALSQAGSAADRLRDLFAQAQLTETEVTQAIALLEECGARAYAEQLADQRLQAALAELKGASPEPAVGEALQQFANALVQRAR